MTVGSGNILEGGLILLAGMAVVACVWTVRRQHLRWPGWRAKRRVENSPAQENSEQELCSGLEELCGRVNDALDRLDSQCDARVKELHELIAAADDRIGRLERLEQQAAHVPHAKFEQGVRSAARPPVETESTQVAASQRLDIADSKNQSSPAAAVPNQVSGTPVRCDPPPVIASRAQRIYDLADGGLAAIKIAEAVAVPLGEVELTLSLRRFSTG